MALLAAGVAVLQEVLVRDLLFVLVGLVFGRAPLFGVVVGAASSGLSLSVRCFGSSGTFFVIGGCSTVACTRL